MKTLEEKKLLLKMTRMLGEPVDPLLVESIEREEQLSKIMFGEEPEPLIEEIVQEEPPVLLKEADPFPVSNNLLQKLSQFKSATPTPAPVPAPVPAPAPEPPKVPPMIEKLQKDELEALKKTLNQVINKVNTLSWGGGGTGIVRIYDADDLDRNTIQEDRVVKWQNGMFRLDTVTGTEDLTYGSFSDTTNQTANLANTAYEVRFNTTDVSKEHYIRNNTEIVSNTTGTYNYAFSMQITSSSSSLHNIYIWVRKNNTDIPNTATILSLSSNKQFVVAAWNFFVDMNAGDHLHLMWAVDDTRISIVAPAATLFCPAVPSVILTINEISKP